MPWDPDTYNRFKNIRYQPFFDLLELVSADGLKQGLDIGCGTGEQTGILAEKFAHADFLGIDASPEMLSESMPFRRNNLRFEQTAVETFMNSAKPNSWGLVFSNAALQWSDNHEDLFARLITLLDKHGQLAVQMPVQRENLLNIILLELVQEKPFADMLDGWKRESPLLSIDQYAQIMFENGLQDIQIIQKVYPIITDSADRLFDFIAGSSLIPYMERLPESGREHFITAYKQRIQTAFKRFPAIYAFKRLLLYGRRKD